MRLVVLLKPALAAAALALISLPTNSSEGSCQGDIYWYESTFPGGPITRRLTNARCISFGCPTTCIKSSVAGEHWDWTVCKCGADDDLDCCTLLWHYSGQNVYASTTGTCPPCGESGTCSAKTITIYTSTVDGTTTWFRETTAICSG